MQVFESGDGAAARAFHTRLRRDSVGDLLRQYFNYFSNQRPFALPSTLGKVIGKPMLFSLANSWAKFYPGRHAAKS